MPPELQRLASVTPEGWGVLAVLVVLAVLADYGLARAGLELLRPTSRWVFWIGRAAKLAAYMGFCVAVNTFWCPRYLGVFAPTLLVNLEWLVGLAGLALAVATLPRHARGWRPA
jgi:hypothetical protein